MIDLDAIDRRVALDLPRGGYSSIPTYELQELARLARTAADSLPRIKEGAAAPAAPASELPELPEPLEIDWPELHSHALGCGVEDRSIHGRYEAAEYGWQDGVDKAMECVPDAIYDADMVREYGAACFAAGRATAPVVDAVPKWISVDEKEPGLNAECYIAILTHYTNAPPEYQVTRAFYSGGHTWSDGVGFMPHHYRTPTHWMLVNRPAAPAPTKEGSDQ